MSTVLMVEDDAAIREMFKVGLEFRGFEVIEAADGAVGLHLSSEVSPDVVLLDLRLPDQSGEQVLEKLKQSPSTAQIPVVILSNYDEPELVSRMLEAGAELYVVKAETTPTRLATIIVKLMLPQPA